MDKINYFLVYYDDGYRNMDTEGENKKGVVNFLKREGFKCTAGFWGCPWYWIDLNNKNYKPGRPGVAYGSVIGDHAITFEEFKIIYRIFKQYEGEEILSMKVKNNEKH